MRVLLFFVAILSVEARTATFTIMGPCDESPLVEVEFNTTEQNVGELSIQILEAEELQFLGDERGIAQIDESPLGDDALEIISETELKSYGWCFEVDGVQPGVYPNEVPLTEVESSIKWLYGYAHYKDGEWIAMCVPSAPEAPPFICE